MSMENRRKALLGFGVLAAVLIVAVIITWPPPYFDKTEATGAIGAVQKHREQQITPQDVILGDEATRRQQQVTFAYYLNDAGKLQSISAEMVASRAAARAALKNADLQLASLSDEMYNRFVQSIDYAIASIEQLIANDAELQARLANEIADIGARAKNRQLASEDFQALSSRLANVVEQLEVAPCCESRAAVAVKSLANAEEMMAKAAAASKARAFNTEALVQVAADIENGARAMAARYVGSDYADYAEYLSALALQAKVVANADEQLAAIALLQNDEQVASRLLQVSDLLANEALVLEQRALRNADEQLQARTALAARLHNIDEMVEAVNRSVANRASFLRDQEMQAFSRAMAGFAENLASRIREFQARAAANINAELASFDAHLASRGQIQARMLTARPAYAAKLADMDNIESHLVSLNRALQADSPLAEYVQNSEQLEARTQELRNRAALAGSLN